MDPEANSVTLSIATEESIRDFFQISEDLTELTVNEETMDLDNFPFGSFSINLRQEDQFKAVNNNLKSILFECPSSGWIPPEEDNTAIGLETQITSVGPKIVGVSQTGEVSIRIPPILKMTSNFINGLDKLITQKILLIDEVTGELVTHSPLEVTVVQVADDQNLSEEALKLRRLQGQPENLSTETLLYTVSVKDFNQRSGILQV